MSENVQYSQGVTLVGDGHVNKVDLAEALAHAPVLVAADGGANKCLIHGKHPVAVIGDFDSLSKETESVLQDAQLIRIAEQDTTDFEKCLTSVDAPFIIAVGFTGGRKDHELAAFSALARKVGPPTLILAGEDIIFAAPLSFSVSLPVGTRVSLFPMTEITGQSEGLFWPLDGVTLSPLGQVGTSNRTTGPVKIEFDQTGCLVMTPRAALQQVLAAVAY